MPELTSSQNPPSRLFVVSLGPAAIDRAAVGDLDMRPLGEGLFLVRSELTQSQLYHRLKRAARPQRLFVGVLAEPPKFKGVRPGALKWLRDGG